MVHDSVNKKYGFYLKYSKYGAFTLPIIIIIIISIIIISRKRRDWVPWYLGLSSTFYQPRLIEERTGRRDPLGSIRIQPDQVHILISHFFKTNINTILPSTRRFPNWSLSFRFSDQDFISTMGGACVA
jgi:hypothetical protein